jgi:transcriptional regulator with XRE-family HTH domain
MIRTESEYRRSLEQIEQNKKQLQTLEQHFLTEGLTPEEVTRALNPQLSFQAQLEEEIEMYNRLRRGELPTLHSLGNIGHWLIGVRITQGLSQKELATQLGVSEQQVSRDERNEYHGITVDRAQSILESMNVQYALEEAKLEETIANNSTPSQLAALLKADKNLKPESAAQLTEMFKLAYQAAAGNISRG